MRRIFELHAIPSHMIVSTKSIRGLNQCHNKKEIKLFLNKYNVDFSYDINVIVVTLYTYLERI